jgi:cytosine/adenosine deaminase-related metal-dependent hydrolase
MNVPEPLLIENGTVLVPGEPRAVLQNHSVLIEGGLIKKVALKGQFQRFKGRRIDATRKVVLPGFINAHTHLYGSFARGLTKTKPAASFDEVLKNLWWRLDSALTIEDCYYSAMVALFESIRHGTTTLLDHHASPNAVAGSLAALEKAVNETGLRACLCYEVSDRDGPRCAQAGLEENAAFIRHCRSRRRQKSSNSQAGTPPAFGVHALASTLKGGHRTRRTRQNETCRQKPEGSKRQPPTGDYEPGQVAAMFGLHAAFTLTDATLEKASAMARELGVGCHIHVAEAESDQEFSLRYHGKRVVQRLKESGILGPRSIAAHCVHVTHKEMDLLAETQTAVVHNPQSNMNNAVGVADLLALRERNVLVGLGTDGMTTNLLEELRAGLWSQRLARKHPSLGFQELTGALCSNNPKIASRLFDFPVGQLREGRAGDAIVVDYDPVTPLTEENLLGHLLYGISQATVSATIVGGKVLMENQRLTLNLDEQRINARARELAKELWKRI